MRRADIFFDEFLAIFEFLQGGEGRYRAARTKNRVRRAVEDAFCGLLDRLKGETGFQAEIMLAYIDGVVNTAQLLVRFGIQVL